jgi:hypothetical protein
MSDQENQIAEIIEKCKAAGFPLTPDQAKDFISLDKKLEKAGYPDFMAAIFRIMSLPEGEEE